jgi:putative ABC transport system permease protein
MIAVFAAVVLVNIAVATTVNRRREFGQQRLVGSTPGQVRRMLGFETLVTLVAGLLSGTVAALASIVPYSIALTHTAVPDVGPAIYLGVLGVAVVLTFAANLLSGRRAIRVPALDAVL